MSLVRIVHLSDLHFSEKKDEDVWDTVVDYINNVIQPDSILITGDITDNANNREFSYAKEMLDKLNTGHSQDNKYWIIPGNHDRYAFRGTTWTKVIPTRWLHGYKKDIFEQYFNDYYPKSDKQADLQLGDNGNLWRVRVIGIDSNDSDCWFAQGAVKQGVAASVAKCALDDKQSDLVIALIHHHLLPIPQIEQDGSRRGISGMVNATGLINSGTMLHHLSEAQVNIVLHGHEHACHFAKFSGSGANAGTTVVLAAGSGTGEKTLVGWSLNRVHFNVLELESNRSVFLREVTYGNAGLQLGPQRLVVSGAAIRQARFTRRNRRSDTSSRGLPSSHIKKLFILDKDRSATVIESRTDIAIKSELSFTTKSASGHLDGDADFELEWNPAHIEHARAPFVIARNGDHEAYSCGLPLKAQHAVLLKRLTVRWRWAGAMLLRMSDKNLLPPAAITGLRLKNREFVVLRIGENEEFQQGSITLGMPASHAPTADQFRVDWEEPDHRDVLNPSEELTRALEFCGPGHVELRIPYPAPGYCYYLSWPISQDEEEYRKNREIMKTIQLSARDLQAKAFEMITKGIPPACIRIALYAQTKDNVPYLYRLIDDNDSPDQLNFFDPRSRARAAMFGDAQVISSDIDENNDLRQDECLVLFAPVVTFLGDCGNCPALLRVAAKTDSGLKWPSDEPINEKVSAFIGTAYLAAVHIAWLAQFYHQRSINPILKGLHDDNFNQATLSK
ncbi:metallophosphoesterase [Chitinivorax sp. B]|uniref:metallophosphoesterase family protein n=1 Tax=Chitinivorax sp. B TaxID=2502235 RepID=UPI0010F8FD7B|nr:metallophosphoesterase [Chitinivorax sp. B]